MFPSRRSKSAQVGVTVGVGVAVGMVPGPSVGDTTVGGSVEVTA